MSARIEISIDEYNAFKNRIKELEESNVKKDKLIEELSIKNESLNDALKYIIEDTTHLERVFQWKAIVKAVNESLGK